MPPAQVPFALALMQPPSGLWFTVELALVQNSPPSIGNPESLPFGDPPSIEPPLLPPLPVPPAPIEEDAPSVSLVDTTAPPQAVATIAVQAIHRIPIA
jgi:hypothetical protein